MLTTVDNCSLMGTVHSKQTRGLLGENSSKGFWGIGAIPLFAGQAAVLRDFPRVLADLLTLYMHFLQIYAIVHVHTAHAVLNPVCA